MYPYCYIYTMILWAKCSNSQLTIADNVYNAILIIGRTASTYSYLVCLNLVSQLIKSSSIEYVRTYMYCCWDGLSTSIERLQWKAKAIGELDSKIAGEIQDPEELERNV